MRKEILKDFALYSGVGGGSYGGRKLKISVSRYGEQPLEGVFRCLGGVDSDPDAVERFTRYVGARGTVLDLFTEDQYRRFHGAPPPRGWRQAVAEDLRRAAGYEIPDVIITSAPCKGLSGLLSETRAASDRYSALNELALRGMALALEAWRDDPPAFWVMENVPRMISRGKHLLGQIVALLHAHGYAVSYTVPDLGRFGGLAQTRKRLHLVARHTAKVPVFVFEPPQRPLRSIGEVLGVLPRPGHPAGGLLHQLPSLEFRTWLRLALIPAGGDWRDLGKLALREGVLRDFALAPGAAWHPGVLGVAEWSRPSSTITGRGGVTNGAHAIADPSCGPWGSYGAYGVNDWHETSPLITANGSVGGGRFAIADPGCYGSSTHGNVYRVTEWVRHGGTVTASRSPGGGLECIADPGIGRVAHNNVFRVLRRDEPSVAVTAGMTPTSGGVAIADPGYPWKGDAITGSTQVGSGAPSVADPRCLPDGDERGIYLIQALDGTWHRPMTVLERAALQGLLDPETLEHFVTAMGDAPASRVSEWVGNAIPPPAMEATLRAAGTAILLSRAGETCVLNSDTPAWVAPLARSVAMGDAFPEAS